MEPRINHPAFALPGAMDALQSLDAATRASGVPERTIDLIHLRVSQVNGCEVCIDGHCQILAKAGESEERLEAIANWRQAPQFSDAERAALGLAEAVTRIADCSDPVTDGIWDEAARHYDEPALAALVMAISTINVWNRLNVATRQVPGIWNP